eukprot:gb/GECG01008133.1/.p1 GENE.gb/GECG01008133.1/~~gb/GECG01008133.1/.p1  ORF type:complete len:533 (+),score=42.14 gb/GECG01008133.1/:1-1599(+)
MQCVPGARLGQFELGAPLYLVMGILLQNNNGEQESPESKQVEQRTAAGTGVLYDTDHFNSSPTKSGGAAASGNKSNSGTTQTSSVLLNGTPMGTGNPDGESRSAEQLQISCNMKDPLRSPIIVKLRDRNINLLFDGNDQRLKRVHVYDQALLKLRIGIHALRTNKLYDLYHAFAGTSTGYLCTRNQTYVIPVPGGTLLCSLSVEVFNELKNQYVETSEKNNASEELQLDTIVFNWEDGDPLIVSDIMLSYETDTSPGILYSNECNWKWNLLYEARQQSRAGAAVRLRPHNLEAITGHTNPVATSKSFEESFTASRSDVVITGTIVDGSVSPENLVGQILSPNIAWMESECLVPIGCSKQELLSALGPCDYVRHDCANQVKNGRRIGEWYVYARLGAECLLEADSPFITEVWLSQSMPGHPMFASTAKCRTFVRLVLSQRHSTGSAKEQNQSEMIVDLSSPWKTVREQLCQYGMVENEEFIAETRCTADISQDSFPNVVHNMSSSLLFEVTKNGYIASVGVCAPSLAQKETAR